MKTTEIIEALNYLDYASERLESAYVESEGECTDITTELEGEIDSITTLLEGEGIDSLGRWLKAKEDAKVALKAERDYLSRQINACDKTIERIKELVGQVLRATGQDKVKGTNGYTFSQFVSRKTSVNTDALRDRYEEPICEAIRRAGVPAYVSVSLKASYTIAQNVGLRDGDGHIFVTDEAETSKFTKPQKSNQI